MGSRKRWEENIFEIQQKISRKARRFYILLVSLCRNND